MAEPSIGPIRDGPRALDQPRARQGLRRGARRADLARARRRAALHDPLRGSGRPRFHRRRRVAHPLHRRPARRGLPRAVGPLPAARRAALVTGVAGRRVLYTGAAGGLGLETTLLLLEAGAEVVAVDNDPAKLAALTAVAQGAAGLRIAALDLADQPGLRAGLDALTAEVGGIDVVVNNAAIYPAKPFEDFTLAEYQAVQRVNVESAVICVQAALPHMRARGWGRIVNIASVTVSGGWPNLAP
ncbi:MAG: SDR family NAD(P)-dependent oxidoreductase, partial [Rhodobacteraceae bacterium]|nr:SDR family NAD(P)-dependent oxidoreductase [Paracoccaceae bacterium]